MQDSAPEDAFSTLGFSSGDGTLCVTIRDMYAVVKKKYGQYYFLATVLLKSRLSLPSASVSRHCESHASPPVRSFEFTSILRTVSTRKHGPGARYHPPNLDAPHLHAPAPPPQQQPLASPAQRIYSRSSRMLRNCIKSRSDTFLLIPVLGVGANLELGARLPQHRCFSAFPVLAFSAKTGIFRGTKTG
jgi:hypothetical protein